MAGAGMNGIKARIKSVKSTMQITGAMELVATSKLRRAKEKVERTRPFTETLKEAIDVVISEPELAGSIYSSPVSNKVLYVVIAGDRGLAGGYNANLFRMTASNIKDGDLVLPIGKKSCEYYKSRTHTVWGEGVPEVADVGVGEALALGEAITRGYLNGDYGRVVIVYTKFVSMMTQMALMEDVLPFSRSSSSGATPECDGDPEVILDAIVPRYLGGALYSALCEAVASESGARRSAMNAANKNAKEMIDGLMLKYNRARQAVITQEITEIVSGAEAL